MASTFSSSYNVSIFVCYSESNCVFVYGALGISKFTVSSSVHMLLFMHNVSYISLYSRMQWSLKLCVSTLASCLWGVCFGYFSKYRIKGLGHRIYLKRNNFVYKIGYSHTVYKMLAFNVCNSPKRFKKEYYFAVRGVNNMSVRNAVFIIQSYRIPNSYCFNGIFVHGLIVQANEGKKGFML